ncbi:hypothetical protein PNEG_02638 [Pneumocystis murina B123]|uniref:Protein BIG1 n=1 Tax=Pneumocystis murina (strain B123) TaxID=1069680 RepID=M7NP26_PNEMU|nr:hypothetical protein PNEG_02638 [Pneumocystis murina B123]EMR08851.1 hypothetical protein PNEG_02638 [Pneumocystis murina B123]
MARQCFTLYNILYFLVLLINIHKISCFEDTSPFIFYRSYSSYQSVFSDHVSTTLSGHAFQSLVRASIDCESTYYVFVLQPGLHADDLKHTVMPWIKKSIDIAPERLVVPYGYGDVDVENIIKYVEDKCYIYSIVIDSQSGEYPLLYNETEKILVVQFPPIVGTLEERRDLLTNHDLFLHYLLTSLPHGSKYSMIYISTPGPVIIQHRDASVYSTPMIPVKYNSNNPKGLFSRYSFFSEGIYMIWIILFILFPIFIIALTAISSIKISYGSFELKKDVIKKNK